MNLSNWSLNTINVDDRFAMRYWAPQLRMSEAHLRANIAPAGNDLAAVRQHVGKLSPPPSLAGRSRQ